MKVTVTQIVISPFGTIPKGLIREQEDLEIGRHAKTIPTIALLMLTRILWRVLKTWGDLLSLKLPLKTIS